MTFWKHAILAATATFAGGVAQAAERKIELDVSNTGCATCAPTVKKAISRLPGVSQVVVKEQAGGVAVATVVFDDDKTTLEELAAASTNAGYPAHAREN